MILWMIKKASLQLSFFFFMQKTAYEIRKGDWSSDVCSSECIEAVRPQETQHVNGEDDAGWTACRQPHRQPQTPQCGRLLHKASPTVVAIRPSCSVDPTCLLCYQV